MEQRVVQAICDDLLDRFMAALNAHDSAAMDACMHFPHARMAEGQAVDPGALELRPLVELRSNRVAVLAEGRDRTEGAILAGDDRRR